MSLKKSRFKTEPLQPKRWQNDQRFVQWLLSKQYAQMADKRGGLEVQTYLTLGTMLYLYEAWAAGVEYGKTRQAN